MPWYYYAIECLSGILLTNGIPHFVQGLCGHRFQTPFASPPAVGESSPVINVIWGWVNFVIGSLLLWFFPPFGSDIWIGWSLVGIGSLLIAVILSNHFGKIRSQRSENNTYKIT